MLSNSFFYRRDKNKDAEANEGSASLSFYETNLRLVGKNLSESCDAICLRFCGEVAERRANAAHVEPVVSHHGFAAGNAAVLHENVDDFANFRHAFRDFRLVAFFIGVPNFVVKRCGVIVSRTDGGFGTAGECSCEPFVDAPCDIVFSAAGALATLEHVKVRIVKLDAGELRDFSVRFNQELFHVEINAGHARVVVVEGQVRGGDENGVDVVNQAVDGARFKEIRRNDGGGVQAEFLGVSGKFPRVRNGKCADVNDDEKFSFAVVCPGFHDGFAFGNGATNAFAGRAANVSANNALFDEQINLLRDFCEVDAPVGIERRMRCGNKSLEFLGHNSEYWFG